MIHADYFRSVFSSVCQEFCPRGGCLLQIFWGVPAPNFRGGACSKFFGGGCLLQIFGGGACSKFSGGAPIFGIRSTFGRYASYWNAFLLFLTLPGYFLPFINGCFFTFLILWFFPSDSLLCVHNEAQGLEMSKEWGATKKRKCTPRSSCNYFCYF